MRITNNVLSYGISGQNNIGDEQIEAGAAIQQANEDNLQNNNDLQPAVDEADRIVLMNIDPIIPGKII